MQQLFLQFPLSSDYLSEDFFVSEANDKALAYINQWPNWASGIYAKTLLIYGEKGCGKTHLAHIWQRLAQAKFLMRIDYEELNHNTLILEDIENFDQESLLHLINFANENQIYLLLTSSTSPAKLKFPLADLNSRILAVPSVAIQSPDQELLKAVLFKSLAERQLKIHPATIDYIITRIDRSFSNLFIFIEKLDAMCKTHKRPITIPLVKQLLDIL